MPDLSFSVSSDSVYAAILAVGLVTLVVLVCAALDVVKGGG